MMSLSLNLVFGTELVDMMEVDSLLIFFCEFLAEFPIFGKELVVLAGIMINGVYYLTS